MNKKIVKKIFVESQEFIQKVKLVERQITIEKKDNYVFIGRRRTGKTYFMFQIIQEKIRMKEIVSELQNL